MAMNPALVVRVAASLADFKKNLEGALPQIETTAAAMKKIGNSLDGDKIIAAANAAAAKVQELGGASRLTEAEMGKVNKTVTEAIAKYKALGSEAPAHMLALQAETTKAATSTGILDSTFAKFVGAFSVASLLDKGISSIVSMGKEVFTSAGRIVDLAQKTGLSTDAVQRLGHVAQQAGGTVEQYADAVFKLGLNTEIGGKKSVDALNALHLSHTAIKNLKPEEQFDIIARALAGVSNIQERNALGVALMGKAYANVAAGLEDYPRLINEARITTEENVKAIDAAADAWDAFKAGIGAGFKTVVGGALVEIGKLTEAAASSNQYMYADQARINAIRQEAHVQWVKTLGTLDKFDLKNGGAISSVADFAARLKEAQIELQGLTPAQREQLDAAKKLGDGFEDLAGRYGLGTDAQRIYGDSTKAASTLIDKQSAAVKSLADRLSGKALAKQVTELADAVTAAGGASKVTAYETERLGDELDKLVEQGAYLSPELQRLRVAHLALDLQTRLTTVSSSNFVAMISKIGTPVDLAAEHVAGLAASLQASLLPFDQAIKHVVEQAGTVTIPPPPPAVSEAWLSVLGAIEAGWHGIKDTVGGVFADLLTGQIGFKDGMIAIWDSARDAVSKIFSKIAEDFTTKVVGGILSSIASSGFGKALAGMFSIGGGGASGFASGAVGSVESSVFAGAGVSGVGGAVSSFLLGGSGAAAVAGNVVGTIAGLGLLYGLVKWLSFPPRYWSVAQGEEQSDKFFDRFGGVAGLAAYMDSLGVSEGEIDSLLNPLADALTLGNRSNFEQAMADIANMIRQHGVDISDADFVAPEYQYARGAIVNSPMWLVDQGGRRRGVMGEAGPEAIVPLNGRGIVAGGGGLTINGGINVDASSTDLSQPGAARRLVEQIRVELQAAFARGELQPSGGAYG